MEVISALRERRGGLVLFALTPPRLSTPPDRVAEIAHTTMERLHRLGVDGLILYDIDDESSRNPAQRPFPFSPTLDPTEYPNTYLADWRTPVAVYRAVGKYSAEALGSWLSSQDLRRELNPDLLLGGVAIPERHSRRNDEHLRLRAKQQAGCGFFVTQVVYDVNAAKNLVSDYRYECVKQGVDPAPFIFTFSVCGSMKTLDFLRWLGVDVPRWIENDLRHSADPLAASLHHAYSAALELIAFCEGLHVPYGINVESVSIRRVEIDASVELARRIIEHLRG